LPAEKEYDISEIVELINPEEDARWDNFVANHPYGWICHLSGWKQALEKSFSHMKGYYPVLIDPANSQIKAGMPVFAVKSWLTGKRLVGIPFATLCDPLIESNEEFKQLLDAVFNLSNKIGTTCIEIRTLSSFHFIQNNQLGASSFYKHHYLLLDNEPEQLKKKFHRSCVRQRISRAIDSKLTLRSGDQESDLATFYQLYIKTRKRLSLPPQPYIFFKSLWETFSPKQNLTLLTAEKDEKAIASLILFKFGNRVSAEFAASDETFKDLSPNHYLFWEAIKSAYDGGYKIFDFGRTSPDNKSLMDFKRHWGTTVIDLPQYYYPRQLAEKLSNKEGALIYRLIKKLCEGSPDSVLKQIGNLCYRHLG